MIVVFSYDRLADAPLDENGQVQKKYDIIQLDGLAGVGERIDPGDVYVNKQTPSNANDNSFSGPAASAPYKNAPMTYKAPVAGHIDKVMISDTDNDQTLIKVLVRQTRRPELGDKFSSRHGQKGVCGLIVNQEDMPFNDQGIVPGERHPRGADSDVIPPPPDTIMNPHGFPSRMTVGKMIELLAGKVCLPFCPFVQWLLDSHIHNLLGWCTCRQIPIRHRLWRVQGQAIISDGSFAKSIMHGLSRSKICHTS